MPSGNKKPSETPSGETRQITIGADLSGKRIDRALADAFGDLSRSRLHALIEQGAVTLNGAPPKAAAKVREGDLLVLAIPAAIPSDLEPEQGDLKIRYEDESLLVVAKPAGVIVHPGAGVTRGTLAAFLLEHCGALSQIGGVTRPGIVHRLDKGTSGLLVVAKNDHAHRALSDQFKAREVTKVYAAISFGTPKPTRGSVKLPLGRDPRNRQRMAVVDDGRAAHTDYEVTELLGPASVVRLTLHTGRTHQIRVHMASLGSPLVGDNTYGAASRASRSPAQFRPIVVAFPRPALHAQILGFTHPLSGEAMTFDEPWPADLTGLRDDLRLAMRKAD